MIAITVDDEKAMLTELTEAVKASNDISSVIEFSTCSSALEWMEKNKADIAFLDIAMRGMGGLVLAEKIQELQPDCKIVFCTGYPNFALEAFRIHVSGYLLKPITAEDVQREIDHIGKNRKSENLLTIQCFGDFEVFHNGQPLCFHRTKTKELLAYLVDRNGAGVAARQICARLWPEQDDDSRQRNYLYQLLNDLNYSLEAVGAKQVLIKGTEGYAIDVQRVDCDYYNFLKTGFPKFFGEYMSQYSWAEVTCSLLMHKK